MLDVQTFHITSLLALIHSFFQCTILMKLCTLPVTNSITVWRGVFHLQILVSMWIDSNSTQEIIAFCEHNDEYSGGLFLVYANVPCLLLLFHADTTIQAVHVTPLETECMSDSVQRVESCKAEARKRESDKSKIITTIISQKITVK